MSQTLKERAQGLTPNDLDSFVEAAAQDDAFVQKFLKNVHFIQDGGYRDVRLYGGGLRSVPRRLRTDVAWKLLFAANSSALTAPLSIQTLEIRSLAELEKLSRFTELRSLKITDVAFKHLDISAQPQLQQLELVRCKGLESLGDLTKTALTTLTIDSCPSLKKLPSTKLSTLGLRHMPFAALNDLQLPVGLQKLHLRSCTALTNLEALKTQRQLQVLDLIGCSPLADLSPLQGLEELRVVALFATAVERKQLKEPPSLDLHLEQNAKLPQSWPRGSR